MILWVYVDPLGFTALVMHGNLRKTDLQRLFQEGCSCCYTGMSHCKVCCLRLGNSLQDLSSIVPSSLGASAAAADSDGVKASSSGGAAASDSAGVVKKSDLGLKEKMKRHRAAQRKVSDSPTIN